jgi:acetyl esterase/lipase
VSEEKILSTLQKAILQGEAAKALFPKAHCLGKKWSFDYQGLEYTSLFYPGNFAFVVDIHGGGFAFKSVMDNDVYCAYLNRSLHYSILNVDFPLSYEKPYPAQTNTILAELDAFMKQHPEERYLPLFLVGHSSGANLAASLALQINDGKLPFHLAGCLLDYPFLDLSKDPLSRPAIPDTFPNFLLSDWANLYCPASELRKTPYVSPLFMKEEQAKHFPPTFITIASHCRLQGDGLALYDILEKAGVQCHLLQVDERHGFIERNMRNIYLTPLDPGVVNAKHVTDQSFEWLRQFIKKEGI